MNKKDEKKVTRQKKMGAQGAAVRRAPGYTSVSDYEPGPVDEKKARMVVRRTLENMLPQRFSPAGAIWQVRWERTAMAAMILSFSDDDPDIDRMITSCGYDDYTLRILCARQIERTLPPSRWRDYVVQDLQRHDPPGSGNCTATG